MYAIFMYFYRLFQFYFLVQILHEFFMYLYRVFKFCLYYWN